MKPKPLPQSILEDAHVIRAKIKEEAAYQTADIAARSKKEADSIRAQARSEAQRKKDEMLKEMERAIARTKEKILSTLSLEKKKIILDGKNKFAQAVIAQVQQEAGAFRADKEYASFLKRAILEGARVIDSDAIEVRYASVDAKLINADFIREAGAFVANTLKKNVALSFEPGKFSDIGVVMQSPDGRLHYDNRFSSRLQRVQDELFARLLREAF
jgi:vacuolar-type H+-ATPase subunit E/Vma4